MTTKDYNNDPLGILGDKPAAKTEDPLGILEPPVKKKVGMAEMFLRSKQTKQPLFADQSGVSSGASESESTSQKAVLPKIEDYNKNFEEFTGHKEFDLDEPVKPEGLLSQDQYEQQKKSFDLKKYEKYRDIEEKEISPVLQDVTRGTASASSLSALYNTPHGKKIVANVIGEVAPEAGSLALESDVVGNERRWDEIAKAINVKNRPQGVEQQNQYFYELDNDVFNSLKNLESENVYVSGGTGGAGVSVVKKKFPTIDTNNTEELGEVLRQIESADRLVSMDGKDDAGAKQRLIEQIDQKIKYLKAFQPISPDITALDKNDVLTNAITRVNLRREKGEGISSTEFAKYDKENKDHFILGLNYIKDVSPGTYKNIVRAIKDKEEIPDVNFRYLSRIGQDIKNQQLFTNGAVDPEAIGKETSLDYLTYQDKKSLYASEIGQYLKDNGLKNVRQFTKKQIKQAAQNLRLPNQEIVNDLANEEGILFYDAIPKSGGVEAFARGFMQPIAGIKQTIQTWGESPTETYLRSQQYDVGIGGQKVPGKEGQMSNRLRSDQSNIWYDVMEGFGQFVPQVLITRGIGTPLAGAARTATSLVPRATLTARQASNIINYGGTFISTYMQEYGSAYEEALEKTGDPRTAKAMGAINGISAASFELFLPDTKIAEKAAGLLRTKYGGSFIDILKKGASPENISRGRNLVSKLVSETLGTIKQEVKEEVGTNIANYITESIFSPRTAADRFLGKEVLETAKATAVSMLIPAVLGGGGAAVNKDFTVNGLHAAAINFNGYKEALDKAFTDDNITRDEYNNGIKLLSTHRHSIANAPVEKYGGKPISQSEALEYAYQETMVKSFKEKMKESASETSKKFLEEKINKAQEIQRRILEMPAEELKEGEKPIEVEKDWESRVIPAEEEMKLNEVQEDQEPVLSPSEVIAKAATEGVISGMEGEMVKTGQITPEQATLELAKQKYGVSDDGSIFQEGGRDISMKTSTAVDEAVSAVYPDVQSVIDAIKNPAPVQEEAAKGEPEQTSQPIELSVDTQQGLPDSNLPEGKVDDQGLILYHGSPYSIDRFSLKAGEGNKDFGHGVYFNDLENVVKAYSNKVGALNKNIPRFADVAIIEEGSKEKEVLLGNLSKKLNDGVHSPKAVQEAIDYINNNNQQVLNKLESRQKSSKNIYKVIINEGKISDWVDWNKALTKSQLDKITAEFNKTNKQIPKEMAGGVRGSDAYQILSKNLGSDELASDFLSKAGIDGIKYSGGESGGNNYVVFDPKSIRIDEINNRKQSIKEQPTPTQEAVKGKPIKTKTGSLKSGDTFKAAGQEWSVTEDLGDVVRVSNGTVQTLVDKASLEKIVKPKTKKQKAVADVQAEITTISAKYKVSESAAKQIIDAAKTAKDKKKLAAEIKKIIAKDGSGPLALSVADNNGRDLADPTTRVSFDKLGITEQDTVDTVIDKLIQFGGPFSEILKQIKQDGNLPSVNIQFVKSLPGNESGLYYPQGGENGGLLQVSDRMNVYYTVAHELMHFFTLDSKQAEKVKDGDSYKSLEDIFNFIASKKGRPNSITGATVSTYGLTNVKEFMAELLINPAFRQEVQDVFAANYEEIRKASRAVRDSNTSSIIDLIKNYFRDLFEDLVRKQELNIDDKKSAVENAAQIATELFFGGKDVTAGQQASDSGAVVVGMPGANKAALALPAAVEQTDNADVKKATFDFEQQEKVAMSAASEKTFAQSLTDLKKDARVVFPEGMENDHPNGKLIDILTGEYSNKEKGYAAATMIASRLVSGNNFLSKLFSKTGNQVKIVYDSRPESAIMSGFENGTILLNAYKLGERLQEFWGEKRFMNWAEMALYEEAIHLATFKVADATEMAKVAKELTKEEREYVAALYGKSLKEMDPATLGYEYVRQMVQGNLFGTVTELLKPNRAAINVLSKLLKYLKGVLFGTNDRFATAVIQRVQDYIDEVKNEGRPVTEQVEKPRYRQFEFVPGKGPVFQYSFKNRQHYIQKGRIKSGEAFFEVEKTPEGVWVPVNYGQEMPGFLGYNITQAQEKLAQGRELRASDDDYIDEFVNELWDKYQDERGLKGEDPIQDFEFEFGQMIVQDVMMTHLMRDPSYEADQSDYERQSIALKASEFKMNEIISDVFGKYGIDDALDYFVSKLQDPDVPLAVKNILSRLVIERFEGRPDIANNIRTKIDTKLAAESAIALGSRVNQRTAGLEQAPTVKNSDAAPRMRVNPNSVWGRNLSEQQSDMIANAVEGAEEIVTAKNNIISRLRTNSVNNEEEKILLAGMADYYQEQLEEAKNENQLLKKEIGNIQKTIKSKLSKSDIDFAKAKASQSANQLRMKYQDKKTMVDVIRYVQEKINKIAKKCSG